MDYYRLTGSWCCFTIKVIQSVGSVRFVLTDVCWKGDHQNSEQSRWKHSQLALCSHFCYWLLMEALKNHQNILSSIHPPIHFLPTYRDERLLELELVLPHTLGEGQDTQWTACQLRGQLAVKGCLILLKIRVFFARVLVHFGSFSNNMPEIETRNPLEAGSKAALKYRKTIEYPNPRLRGWVVY